MLFRSLQPSKGRSGITFGEWASSPRKQPSRVVLPGFQSALASGLAKLPPRPGDDLFFAVTDLLAAGSRTALVSRWRMAGPSSAHLVEEFVRDQRQPAAGAPVPSAAESWHRAVDIVQAEEPDVAQEPRLSQSSDGVLGDSRHPLFWAGYLLADCGSGDRPEPPAQGRPAPGAKPPQPAPRKAAP